VNTTSTNWDLYIYSDADTTSGVFTQVKLASAQNGRQVIACNQLPVIDNDAVSQVHIKYVDNGGSASATATVLGTKCS
jgi:hypothetical protein